MRLIDADALPKYTGYALSADEVAMAVENAPTIDAVPQWIPCEERLPYREHEYLVTVKCGSANNDVAVACYWEGLGFILDADFKTGDITAWMPLPEPYKEETDEQGEA